MNHQFAKDAFVLNSLLLVLMKFLFILQPNVMMKQPAKVKAHANPMEPASVMQTSLEPIVTVSIMVK